MRIPLEGASAAGDQELRGSLIRREPYQDRADMEDSQKRCGESLPDDDVAIGLPEQVSSEALAPS
jgi:hypothetical protein